MNYRAAQLRHILKQHQSKWHEEKNILQQDIINLQNSTDIKLLEQAQQESKRLQKLLDDTVNLLGSSDIKNLTDLSNLLAGRSLKELATEKELLTQKIKDQDLALLNLAKQKLTGKKDAEKLLSELETKWSKKEIEWEQERKKTSEQQERERDNWTSELAKSKETITNLEKELKQQGEQIKTLSESNDKLQREKETLILSKNQAVEQIQTHQDNLRKINVLFDDNAVNYENIDFNGLYSLLAEVSKRERERERERDKTDKKPWWK